MHCQCTPAGGNLSRAGGEMWRAGHQQEQPVWLWGRIPLRLQKESYQWWEDTNSTGEHKTCKPTHIRGGWYDQYLHNMRNVITW